MSNNKAKWMAIPFIIIILGIFFINIIVGDKTISTQENRTLQQKPTIEDLKDGTYGDKFESYFSDQFVFREELSKIYSRMKIAIGNSKINSYYYLLEDNWIMPSPSKIIPDSELKDMAKEINDLAEIGIKTGKKVYYVSTPHKDSVLSYLYPKHTDGLDNTLKNEKNVEKYFDATKIKIINIDEYFLSEFTEKEREKLYFKTDHHWNGIGAFEGFKYIVEKMDMPGVNPSWDKYVTTTYDKGRFLGSYNKNIGNLVKEKESIPYVYLKDKPHYEFFTFDGVKEIKKREEDFVATHRNRKEIIYGGAYMFSSSCSILKIRNKDALSDKKIIIFIDSYQPPTSLMFADVFSEVQLVDPRYIEKLNMSVEDIIKESDVDILMFMYNNRGFKEMINTMEEHG